MHRKVEGNTQRSEFIESISQGNLGLLLERVSAFAPIIEAAAL
jgi:hypothetical protein